tara:strand:+ start:1046 stop:1210 length:165 start_codon:yes stop_codon:yes gene_type:complete
MSERQQPQQQTPSITNPFSTNSQRTFEDVVKALKNVKGPAPSTSTLSPSALRFA